jgi:preprotein translocase subunit SecD
MRQIWWVLTGIVLLFLVAVYIDLPSTSGIHFGPISRNVQFQKGLDLAGGVRVLLCTKGNKTPTSAEMAAAADVVRQRAAGGLGVTEPQVSVVGGNCIDAEIPGAKNQAQVIQTIGSTGLLVIGDSGSTPLAAGTTVTLSHTITNTAAKPHPIVKIIVPGKYVNPGSAQVQFDQTNNPTVVYTLRDPGSTAWCNYTTANVGKYSPIVLDNKVVSDPSIQGAICGGNTQITFPPGTTVDSPNGPNTIKILLNYGALPVALSLNSHEQVSATLGPEYVHKAVLAGIVGLVLVALFMLLYYRLPGLIADIALLIYAFVVLALFKFIPVTMTLAGVAGFILSIGMAVDANVLIFERVKEELRAGKTLGSAIDSGFNRAWTSIRDSNISTMITTVILYWFGQHFGTTIITGFATTLFIGVAVSMFTAIIVTRTFLRVLVATGRFRSLGLWGLPKEETELSPTNAPSPGGSVA